MAKIIKRAEVMGFCFGVRRAVDMAEKHPGRLNTLGSLIHNPQEVARLAEQGKVPIEKLEQANEKTVLIRAHGVPDFIIRRAVELGYEVVDATCPFVKKAQTLAKHLEETGYQVIIIGEPDHPEIIGIVGNLKQPVIVETLAEARQLGQYDRIGIIMQTTSNVELASQIEAEIRKHSTEVKAMATICQATQEHQAAVRALAPNVDVMVVVGGKTSGNTTRLYEISKNYTTSYHIETVDDLDINWFAQVQKIGLTAGASTPDWIIDAVENKIRSLP